MNYDWLTLFQSKVLGKINWKLSLSVMEISFTMDAVRTLSNTSLHVG